MKTSTYSHQLATFILSFLHEMNIPYEFDAQTGLIAFGMRFKSAPFKPLVNISVHQNAYDVSIRSFFSVKKGTAKQTAEISQFLHRFNSLIEADAELSFAQEDGFLFARYTAGYEDAFLSHGDFQMSLLIPHEIIRRTLPGITNILSNRMNASTAFSLCCLQLNIKNKCAEKKAG